MQIGDYTITWDQVAWALFLGGVLYLLLDGIFNYTPPARCGKPCPRCGCGCEYPAGHENWDHGHFVPGRRYYPAFHTWDEGAHDISNHPRD